MPPSPPRSNPFLAQSQKIHWIPHRSLPSPPPPSPPPPSPPPIPAAQPLPKAGCQSNNEALFFSGLQYGVHSPQASSNFSLSSLLSRFDSLNVRDEENQLEEKQSKLAVRGPQRWYLASNSYQNVDNSSFFADFWVKRASSSQDHCVFNQRNHGNNSGCLTNHKNLLRSSPQISYIANLALDPNGTKVVRSMIENAKTKDDVHKLLRALVPMLEVLVLDQNGYNVLMRFLELFGAEENAPIFEAAIRFMNRIVKHTKGCLFLEQCIQRSTGEQQLRLIKCIGDQAVQLAQEPYGNYLVQALLSLGHSMANNMVASMFCGNFIKLSTNKYGSNVVEKCLQVFEDDNKTMIVLELLSVPDIQNLLKHPYANFVFQTALESCNDHVREMLLLEIISHKGIRNNPYGRRLYEKASSNCRRC